MTPPQLPIVTIHNPLVQIAHDQEALGRNAERLILALAKEDQRLREEEEEDRRRAIMGGAGG